MVKFHRELIQRPKSQLYEPVHFEMLSYAMIYGVPTNCWKMHINDEDLVTYLWLYNLGSNLPRNGDTWPLSALH